MPPTAPLATTPSHSGPLTASHMQGAHSCCPRARCALGSKAPVHGEALTVLRVSLHHPTPGSSPFASVPPQLEHDTSPLLVGRGPDAHLRLQLPRLSRQHLSLEPYLEKGGAQLAFSLKALSRKGSVWVNGLTLRFLEQVPLGAINRVAFSGIQMVVRIEGGTSLEAFVCCFHLSLSPLIYRLHAEETDERESVLQEQPPPGSRQGAPGPLRFLHSPLQPSPGEAPEIPLQREPLDGVLS
ncbi:TRAF-interacting protein with FHA domain-containing protein B [Dama dama]|uniref:TRAF-interacting protein with FHA domain-containing protein B n=1 Tax=Dama dama TaxID=30532 RepID=UPI002A35E086|nr:TRAF-interacting protein with FHA domain-containing protein B [Dama dama]